MGERLTGVETNYADAQLKLIEAEAEHTVAMKAKDEEFKLKVEEHTACSAALSLKESELEIIRDRIQGYQQTMVTCQRATEAGKDARLQLEAQLAEKDRLKV